MAQRYAHYNTDCDECMSFIVQDEPVYFNEGGKLCTNCATKMGLVCPECSAQKRAGFDCCYECHKRQR